MVDRHSGRSGISAQDVATGAAGAIQSGSWGLVNQVARSQDYAVNTNLGAVGAGVLGVAAVSIGYSQQGACPESFITPPISSERAGLAGFTACWDLIFRLPGMRWG